MTELKFRKYPPPGGDREAAVPAPGFRVCPELPIVDKDRTHFSINVSNQFD